MNQSIRIFAAAMLAALAILPATAQQQTAQQQPQPFGEVIDVRVINVDVVVTDRKGNPITGLKREDFEIFENGVPKAISNFYEVEGNRAKNVEVTEVAAGLPAEARPEPKAEEIPDNLKRRVIFYVDNLSLAPFNRNRVFTQMKEFLKNVMRPGDEAMVATFNRSMKVRVPFTKDIGQISQTLDVIAGESAMGTAGKSERKQVEERIRDARSWDEAVMSARQYAQSVEHDLRQSASSLNALMSTLAGVEGKKILVLTSEGFPLQPGRELFYYIDELSREKGWSQGGTMIEGMGFNSASLIQDIARTANANGITMYALHAAGLSAGSEFSAENARATSYAVSHAEMTNSAESMQLMAQMTGGLATLQTNNFAQAFRNIQRDLDSYYSLGYRAGTQRVDRQRHLQVKVKNKNYVVRSRQTFVEKSVFAEMSDKVVANLLYRSKENQLRILARVGTPAAVEGGLFRVPVDVQIPLDNLTLLPQGETEHVGGFEVYVVVADKNNDMSDVARKSHSLRIPTSDMERAKGKYYTYTLELLMERGLNRISIGVVDTVGNTSGFVREQIIAQDLR